jgi:hypothetical protein
VFLGDLKSIAVDGPIVCGKKRTSGFVVSCGGFLVFLGYQEIFDWESLGFLMRQGDDFDCKIVVTTWWLGAKTWLFDGG